MEENVYNGAQKVNSICQNFMTPNNIILAIKSLKIKNCVDMTESP